LLTLLLLPLLIELIAWQPVAVQAGGPGLDPSWTAGLELAVHNHIAFGDELVWTYGPLGFLSIPFIGFGATWFNHLGQAAFAYVALIRFGVATALFTGARANFGYWPGFLLAALVASAATQFGELIIALFVGVWLLWVPRTGVPAERRRDLLACAAIGAFAGFQLLNKESIGITVGAMGAVAVICLPRYRRDATIAAIAAFVVVLIALWLALHQSLGELPDYLFNSARVSSGYSAAMAIDEPGTGWAYSAALFAFVIGVWAAYDMTTFATVRARRGILLLWLVLSLSAFKEGFVRLEGGHLTIFFDAMLGGFLVFRLRREHRPVGLLAIVALTVFALAPEAQSITNLFDPSRNISAAVDEARDLVSASRRAQLIANARTLIAAAVPLSPQSLGLLQGHTVAVFPQEISVVWAYHLKWRPIPVMQSYAAYSPALDKLDADFLGGPDAPERLLVQATDNGGIDGRVLSFDEAMTSRMILCRYRMLLKTPDFAVLGRVPNRCGREQPIAVVHADWDQPVRIPVPLGLNTLVTVRIDGVEVGGLERLVDLVFKPRDRFVVLDRVPHRLVPATAADGLPLRAASGVDLPAPFQFAAGASTIAVSRSGQNPTGGRPITYSFSAQTVAP
jgi:hypothetical protein